MCMKEYGCCPNLKLKINELDDPMISYVSIDEHEILQFSFCVMSIFSLTWTIDLFQVLESYINLTYIDSCAY